MAHFQHVRAGATRYGCGLILQVHLELITGRFVQRTGRFATLCATGEAPADTLGFPETGIPECAYA